MGWSKIRIVVDRDRVLTETARRLHQDHDVAGLERGRDNLARCIATAIDKELTGCTPPRIGDRRHELGGELGEPLAMRCRRNSDRLAGELLGCQPLGILSTGCDQCVDQRVACGGIGMLTIDRIEWSCPRDLTRCAKIVTGRAHRSQQLDHRDRGVQPDGVADPRVLGRVGREHDRNAPLLDGDVP